MKDIFKGQLVRLSAMDHEEFGKAYATWNRDSELMRLMDSGASVLHSVKAGKDFFEKMVEKNSPEHHFFSIRGLSITGLDETLLLGSALVTAKTGVKAMARMP